MDNADKLLQQAEQVRQLMHQLREHVFAGQRLPYGPGHGRPWDHAVAAERALWDLAADLEVMAGLLCAKQREEQLGIS